MIPRAEQLFTEAELEILGTCVYCEVPRDEALQLCIRCNWDHGAVYKEWIRLYSVSPRPAEGPYREECVWRWDAAYAQPHDPVGETPVSGEKASQDPAEDCPITTHPESGGVISSSFPVSVGASFPVWMPGGTPTEGYVFILGPKPWYPELGLRPINWERFMARLPAALAETGSELDLITQAAASGELAVVAWRRFHLRSPAPTDNGTGSHQPTRVPIRTTGATSGGGSSSSLLVSTGLSVAVPLSGGARTAGYVLLLAPKTWCLHLAGRWASWERFAARLPDSLKASGSDLDQIMEVADSEELAVVAWRRIRRRGIPMHA